MKNKRFLTAILLGVVLCFVVSEVGYGEVDRLERPPNSEMTESDAMASFLQPVFDQWFRGLDQSEKFTFLVIPINAFVYTQDGGMVINWSLQYVMAAFQRMYPDAEISSEFSGIGETESTVNPKILQSMLSSMLLTMAYQQGYYIYAVAKDYIILVKKIQEKSEEVE